MARLRPHLAAHAPACWTCARVEQTALRVEHFEVAHLAVVVTQPRKPRVVAQRRPVGLTPSLRMPRRMMSVRAPVRSRALGRFIVSAPSGLPLSIYRSSSSLITLVQFLGQLFLREYGPGPRVGPGGQGVLHPAGQRVALSRAACGPVERLCIDLLWFRLGRVRFISQGSAAPRQEGRCAASARRAEYSPAA
jgi:hypothetical protein